MRGDRLADHGLERSGRDSKALTKIIQDQVEVETKVSRHAGAQAGNLEICQANKAKQRIDELGTGRGLSENVQTIPNLGTGELTEVTIDVLDQVGEVPPAQVGDSIGNAILVKLRLPLVPVLRAIPVDNLVEVGIESCLLDQCPNLLLEKGELTWIELLELVVFVDQASQLFDLAVTLGGRHGRGKVVHDDRVGAPLCLGPLTRIIDDERIDERQI